LEINVIQRACLQRRVPDPPTLERRVTALMDERNHAQVQIRWHFSTDQAREKMHHIYHKLLDSEDALSTQS